MAIIKSTTRNSLMKINGQTPIDVKMGLIKQKSEQLRMYKLVKRRGI